MNRTLSIPAVIILIFIAVTISSAQDLGSSNKLFGSGSSTPAKKPAANAPKPKKPAVKPAPRPAAKPVAGQSKISRSTKARSKANIKTDAAANPKPTVNDTFTKKGDQRTAQTQIIKAPTLNPSDYNALLQKAAVARGRHEYDPAIAALLEAEKGDPSRTTASIELGSIYEQRQMWADAERSYRQAIAADDTNLRAVIALSRVLTKPVPARDLADRYSEAEFLARSAVRGLPNDAMAHDQLGLAMEMRGSIGSETENEYRRATQIDPSFALAWAHLGRLMRKRGMSSAAETAYSRAIDNSRTAEAKVAVAEILQSESRFSDSFPLLKAAIAQDKGNAAAYDLYGRALMIGGYSQEAENAFMSSFRLNTAPAVSLGLLADLYMRGSKFRLAESTLIRAMDLATGFDRLNIARQMESLGDRLVRENQRADADRVYRMALRLDPDRDTLKQKVLNK